MKFLLNESFFGVIWTRLCLLFETVNFWIGFGLACIGIAFFILAKRLTRVHRRENVVAKDDKVLLTYRILSTLCVVFALIIWIFFC